MALSTDIISQFVKVTNDRDKTSKTSTVYGTAKVVNGKVYVKLDGSDQLTPVTTVTNVVEGERVTVQIKDHTATATGNITSPAARGKEVEAVSKDVGNFRDVTTVNFEAVNAEITKLDVAQGEFRLVITERFEANEADIEDLTAKNVDIDGKLTANRADIDNLQADNAVIQEAVIKDLTAEDGTVQNLNVKFANIDFANIGKAAFDYFFSKSGLIENVIVGDGTVAGTLVGVTIKGDVIEGNTVVADKLVIRGEDGLYYKLNTQGIAAGTYTDGYVKMDTTIDAVEGTLVVGAFTTDGESVYTYTNADGTTVYYTIVDDVYYEVILEADSVKVEQTEYNSLNGGIITAKSITAEQISVHDLVAFGATIGGFNISSESIYSEVKDSEGNTTRGIYLDKNGQVNIGDSTNYIKFVENEDGTYSLAISANDISYALNGAQHSLSDLGKIGEYIDIGVYDTYTNTGEAITPSSECTVVEGAFTPTGEQVYTYTAVDNTQVYCVIDGEVYREVNYVREPCILLGESDSDFKLIITNTRILFMEGTATPAYVSNQALHIKKAVIEEEMRLGQFVWQIRVNGNMGLVWQDTTDAEEATE